MDHSHQHNRDAAFDPHMALGLECVSRILSSPYEWRPATEWLLTTPLCRHVREAWAENEIPEGRSWWRVGDQKSEQRYGYDDDDDYSRVFGPIARRLRQAWEVLNWRESLRRQYAHVGAMSNFGREEALRITLVAAFLLNRDFDGAVLPTAARLVGVPDFPWPWEEPPNCPHSFEGRHSAEMCAGEISIVMIRRALDYLSILPVALQGQGEQSMRFINILDGTYRPGGPKVAPTLAEQIAAGINTQLAPLLAAARTVTQPRHLSSREVAFLSAIESGRVQDIRADNGYTVWSDITPEISLDFAEVADLAEDGLLTVWLRHDYGTDDDDGFVRNSKVIPSAITSLEPDKTRSRLLMEAAREVPEKGQFVLGLTKAGRDALHGSLAACGGMDSTAWGLGPRRTAGDLPALSKPAAPASGDHEMEFAKPTYDAERRELKFDGHVIKRFKQRAANQERVLHAFQEEGWPWRIDDPLPTGKRNETIRSLNQHMQLDLIRFVADGTGEGIRWEHGKDT